MSNFLNEFLDKLSNTELDGYIYIDDCREFQWHYDEEHGYTNWIMDNEIYGTETTSGVMYLGDLVIKNGDNGCGETLTYVFHKDNEISYEELEKYE